MTEGEMQKKAVINRLMNYYTVILGILDRVIKL